MNSASSRFPLDRVLIFVAVVCSLAAILRPHPKPPAEPDMQPLRDEIASLRRAVDEAARQRTPVVSAPETTSPDGVTIRQVHEWVWGLEQRLVQLENVSGQNSVAASGAPAPPDIAQSRQIALNPQASPEERLAALRTLRAANARTSDVVQAMLQLHATSANPDVRADIFRQLSGVKDAILKPPLINALLKDEHPKVREEAAETLASFLADPYVRSTLNAAAQNDADGKVQKQARESLEGNRDR